MKKLYLIWTLLGLLFAPFAWAQNNVTGTVNDETGTPLPGATVIVDGTRTLINTDEGGRFSQTSSFPLASYYENQLILAEAKFKTNDEDGARMHLNNVGLN